MMRHVGHYTSQDVDAGRVLNTWSVYAEDYESPESEDPIDGSQRLVSTHETEAEADAEATRLQREATS